MKLESVVRCCAAALLACAAAVAPAQAQNALITGQVTDEYGRPLEAVQAFIAELSIGNLTNAEGRFNILVPAARVTDRPVTLRVRIIGHVPQSRTITLSTTAPQTQDFKLAVDVNRLSDIVVTGVTTATEQTKLPFTVSKVTAADMPVPAQNPLTQLQGKVTGANIVSASGRPGTAPSVLLRGPKSINAAGRSQGPLYIVDGVLITGGLPDLNPQDIESVEVVKGAAASSLYGSNAGNGVIQITTRRGGNTDGVRFSARVEAGQGGIEGKYPLSQRHFLLMDETQTRFCVAATGQPACARTVDLREEAIRINEKATGDLTLPPATFVQDFGIAAPPGKQALRGIFQVNRWPTQYDAISEAVDPSLFTNTNLDMTGRFGGASIFASASQFQQDGAFQFLEGFQRNTFRLNVDQNVGETFRLGLSTFYSRSRAGAGNADEGGTGFFRLTRVPAGIDLGQRDSLGRLLVRSNPLSGGAQNSNPLYLWDNERQTDDNDRFIGGLNAHYTPLNWLSVDANVGYDRSQGTTQFLRDRGFRITQPSATLPLGRITEANNEGQSLNGSLNASATRQFFTDLDTRFTAGYVYEQRDTKGLSLAGNLLAVPGLETADAAQQDKELGSSKTSVRTTSYLTGISTTWRERYIADVLFRRDGSSLFGSENRWANYGRASLAWRASQEPWWILPQANEFKLRASVGTAGGRPSFAAQYEAFSIGTGGVLTPQTLGNKNLRPETTTEQEYGLDAEFFNRIGLNVTYAFGRTEDQILPIPPSVSTGFLTQWKNAGTLENKTWEVSLNVPIITRRNFTYSTRFNWDRNRTFITKLDVPPFFSSAAGQQGSETMFRFAEGERYGTIYGRKYIRDCGQLPAEYRGQCGGSASQFQRNDEGYIVWTGGRSVGAGITDNLWQAVLPACVNPTTGAAIATSSVAACRKSNGQVNAPFGVPTNWGMPMLMRDSLFGDALTIPIGNTLPDFRWSVSQTLTFRKFSAYALLDAAVGQEVWNEGRHWSLGDFQTRETDQTGKTVESAKPIGYYWRGGLPTHSAGVGGFYDALGPNSRTVETASYAKIREVSLSYNFGPVFRTGDWTLSLIGRNLKTFTDYTGFDPEVGRAGGVTGSAAVNGIDAFQYPNIRTFTFSLGSRF
ncbi:MAG: SusC/RagA family TonB-linked outer membrane protein [Gemmatimonadaceae bacterium]